MARLSWPEWIGITAIILHWSGPRGLLYAYVQSLVYMTGGLCCKLSSSYPPGHTSIASSFLTLLSTYLKSNLTQHLSALSSTRIRVHARLHVTPYVCLSVCLSLSLSLSAIKPVQLNGVESVCIWSLFAVTSVRCTCALSQSEIIVFSHFHYTTGSR